MNISSAYKRYLITALFICSLLPAAHAQWTLRAHESLRLICDKQEAQVVHTAIEIFRSDCNAVLSINLKADAESPTILLGTLGSSSTLKRLDEADLQGLQGKKQAFLLKVLPDNRLLVAGSDAHGTAYGLLELSRLMGVSPWEWWADVTPNPLEQFTLPADYCYIACPQVEYRGIFINDEDWGLMPWSYQTHDPAEKGVIGPKTNARIFELLLRLRANTFWPAMHECTKPFFMTKGNREAAQKYGIYIGTSHCEPLACNVANEWSLRGKGEYNYMTNAREVNRFFEKRVKEVAGQEILYTLGMRGIHDSGMLGVNSVEEQKKALSDILNDQRAMLRKHVNRQVEQVPQVFIPYKEVLDVYNAGLEVPEEVTLMWCDDNYGYIRHFPTDEERARKGGNGIYYHVSYWGRPHDYLWLGTFSPYLLYQQMKEAYDRGIQKMWILNVGDLKPIEYQIELFMDMAWDIESVNKQGVTAHLATFLQREFGTEMGRKLLPVMQQHYRLAYICKPEYLANTRTEERNNPLSTIVKDMPWDKRTIKHRLADYEQISDVVEEIAPLLPDNRRDAYFHLVKYPVQAATQMNVKLLTAQLARHGLAQWEESQAAYDSIVSLTRIYNEGIANDGKWRYIMDHQPRKLPPFFPVKESKSSAPMPESPSVIYACNGADAVGGNPALIEGLGYEGRAAALKVNQEYTYQFSSVATDSLLLELALLPVHPVDGKQLRVAISLNGAQPVVVDYKTVGRSEEWKQNVLRNQAIRRCSFVITEPGKQTLTIKPLDEGVVLDRLQVY